MSEVRFFDAMASSYDDRFSRRLSGRLQRRLVHRRLTKLLKNRESLKILEINCGTGTDALFMASLGHQVVATDASSAMIREAQTRMSRAGLSVQAEFIVSRFQDIAQLAPKGPFDLVFSDFGGLNCAGPAELSRLAEDLSGLLRERGQAFFVIMGTDARWEQFYGLMKGQAGKAFRRKGKAAVTAVFEGNPMQVFYYSPSDIKALFGACFSVEGKGPVGLFIPPSGVGGDGARFPDAMRLLWWLERLHCRLSFLANLADHYWICLRKRQ